ncbi:MAG: DUF4070 domain-containing protein [Patescibacteria group bacterium]|nr:DUF4070 domain-containing protein [Patescibacteria group bacterium]
MKILLLYPKFPATFWSFKYALPFINKKAPFPPLGLLTVAALLPKEWEKRLVDLNVNKLKDEDLKWADFVFISAMIIQKKSVKKIVRRCKKFSTKIVAGGPLFTTGFGVEEFKDEIDHFILNEAEITLKQFLEDFKNGSLKKIYTSSEFPDLTKSPVPLFELINLKDYSSMCLQYSRGCPFNCEFCDIIVLNGRVPRTKTKEQVLNELEKLYQLGWREKIFFVDDNFIGHKTKLKEEILPAIIEWLEKKNYPFSFNTEAPITLADDDELMNLMVKAGFDTVFVGIETPDENSLKECGKFQNINRDLISSVEKMHRAGLQVQGGFIVGFDHDQPSIFKRQIDFIQKSGIVTAMVGILNAFPKTRLYQRLKEQGRLIKNTFGSNTSINFVPKMGKETLRRGYQKILKTIYSPDNYYQRLKTFLRNYRPLQKKKIRFQLSKFKAFLKSIWLLGIIGQERWHYWKIFFWTLFRRPKLFPLAITLSIYGFHFRKISEKICSE